MIPRVLIHPPYQQRPWRLSVQIQSTETEEPRLQYLVIEGATYFKRRHGSVLSSRRAKDVAIWKAGDRVKTHTTIHDQGLKSKRERRSDIHSVGRHDHVPQTAQPS